VGIKRITHTGFRTINIISIMKTILIPTDFNPHAVPMLRGVLANFIDEPVKIILFHSFKLTDSITELLMLSRRTAEYGQIPEAFHKACRDFREENRGTIQSLRIEYFYGSTIAAFRNFAEANEVDAVFYPEGYYFNKISSYSLDPAILLSKSRLPVVKPMEMQLPIVEEIIIPAIQQRVSEMA
jgi:hypothetical protein